ncbi:hypothetical protein LTR86_008154 [Recurvomyces mirabilis]|nr:hypothetical protein LTR86_008154 [Recurvomyces mirabilis]
MKDLNSEAEDARHKINNYFDKNATTGSMSSSNQSGVAGAVTGVTGTLGAVIGGVSRTAGGVVGAAGRGVGHTINNATRTAPVGDGIQGLTNGIESASNSLAHGVEKGSQGKKIW